MSGLATLMFALYVAAQVFAIILIKKWNAEVEAVQGEESTPAKLFRLREPAGNQAVTTASRIVHRTDKLDFT